MTWEALKERMDAYVSDLRNAERSEATIRQYRRDVLRFLEWAAGKDARDAEGCSGIGESERDIEDVQTHRPQTAAEKEMQTAAEKEMQTAAAKEPKTAAAKEVQTAASKEAQTAAANAAARGVQNAAAHGAQDAAAHGAQDVVAQGAQGAEAQGAQDASAHGAQTAAAHSDARMANDGGRLPDRAANAAGQTGAMTADVPMDRADKAAVLSYKEYLLSRYQPASVNVKLAAVNSFLRFAGLSDCCVRQIRIQRRTYCAAQKELTREEYARLVRAAEKRGDERLALIMQTICATGIRVSELKYITVQAVRDGEVTISLKGKTRTILLPGKLKKRLKKYMKRRRVSGGPLFVTRSGRPLDRGRIWRMMKSLCGEAQVDPRKVYPHNLRHLFARTFYHVRHDIASLADVLGHSSLNTTRIYLISTGEEHRKVMDALRLVC